MTAAGAAGRPQVATACAVAFDSFGRRRGGRAGGGRRPAASRARAGGPAGSGRGRVEQVATADDEVDALAEVVDDDAEPVRPVPVPVADRRGRRSAATSSAHGPTIASIQRSLPPPSMTRSIGPSSRARRQPPGHPTPCHRRPCSPPTPRTSTASSRSRRRARRPRVDRAPRRSAASSSRLADRPLVGHEPQPAQVLEEAGVVLGAASGPIVVLDPQQHGRPVARPCPTRTPRSPRGRGGASRSGRGRSASVAPRSAAIASPGPLMPARGLADDSSRRPAGRRSGVIAVASLARARSRVSSSRVAVISRR